MRTKQVAPCLFVSVESRKGGVGKTTAALCMARILNKKKGYTVLVLDLDITGTNAADIAKSPFWIEDLHIIEETDERNSVYNPSNLIKMFDQHFLAGMSIPEFSTQSKEPKTLYIDIERVNVFGSQIYKTSLTDNSDKIKGATCIECPSILFDDLHTLWLLEFVKQIADNFVRATYNGQSTKHAIILDNSPGYVGIGPAIHEWLTDLGPECGKFLTVASLDPQDLRACERSIGDLHNLYMGKWQTSRIFIDGGKKGSEINIAQDQEAFFMRLASSTNSSFEPDDTLAFYKNTGQKPSSQLDEKGQRFCDNPSEYIAIIINLVHEAVKDGRLLFDYEFLPDSDQGRNILSRLFGDSDKKRGWRDRMISYDEYIRNQFQLQFFQRSRERHRERRLHQLINDLSMAEQELRSGTHERDDDLLGLSKMEYENHERLKAELIRANGVVSRARSAVKDARLGHIAGLIHDEWLPGSIVPDFRSVLLRLLRESDFPHFELTPFEFDRDPINPEAREFLTEFRERIQMELVHSNLQEMNDRNRQTVNVLSGILAALVGLSFTSQLLHSPIRKEMSELLALVLSIELKHWIRRGEGKSIKFSVQRFLAQESVSQVELQKDMDLLKPLQFFRHQTMKKGEVSIADFYRACTSAQARLIDFAADSRFLLQLLLFIVKGEIEKGDLFPFVRGIAEDVIIKKTVSHEEAPARMAKALQTAEYFREFDEVLHKVLKVWGVTHE